MDDLRIFAGSLLMIRSPRSWEASQISEPAHRLGQQQGMILIRPLLLLIPLHTPFSPFSMDEWDSQRLKLRPVQGSVPSEWMGRYPPNGDAPQAPPPLQIPRGPPRNWDRGAMIKRIRVGIMIELSTIPLYLYAMYSVKLTPNQPEVGVHVRATLRGSADPPKPLPSASLTDFPQPFCSRRCSISPWLAISSAHLEAL